jgi:hypothetical protein
MLINYLNYVSLLSPSIRSAPNNSNHSFFPTLKTLSPGLNLLLLKWLTQSLRTPCQRKLQVLSSFTIHSTLLLHLLLTLTTVTPRSINHIPLIKLLHKPTPINSIFQLWHHHLLSIHEHFCLNCLKLSVHISLQSLQIKRQLFTIESSNHSELFLL